jgi:hypothetical protein
MRRDIGARLVQVHVLVDVIDPGHGDEMVMLTVRRALLGELDLVRPVQMVDLSNGLPVGRNDVHVLFNLRSIGHLNLHKILWKLERCASRKVASRQPLQLPKRSKSPLRSQEELVRAPRPISNE